MPRSFPKRGVRTLADGLREPGDVPAPMLEDLVRAGYLGRRTGCVFRGHGS